MAVDLPVTVYAVELSMDITCNHSLYFMNLTVSCITDCPLVQRGSYHSAHAGLSCAWFPFWYFVCTEVWIFYIFFILYCLLYTAMVLRIVWKSNMLHAWYPALYFIELTFYYVETLYFNVGYVCHIFCMEYPSFLIFHCIYLSSFICVTCRLIAHVANVCCL